MGDMQIVGREVVMVLERKGWALYHTPVTIFTEDQLREVVEKGRATTTLKQFELYTVLPLVENDRNADQVFSKMETCLETGRLPFFVRLKDKRPAWVLPVDQIGLGYNSVLLLFDPPTCYQYMRVFHYPDPQQIEEVKFEFFYFTYELEDVSEIWNITSCREQALVQDKVKAKEQNYAEFLEMVSFVPVQ